FVFNHLARALRSKSDLRVYPRCKTAWHPIGGNRRRAGPLTPLGIRRISNENGTRRYRIGDGHVGAGAGAAVALQRLPESKLLQQPVSREPELRRKRILEHVPVGLIQHSAPTCVTRGLDHASRVYPTCAPKAAEIG